MLKTYPEDCIKCKDFVKNLPRTRQEWDKLFSNSNLLEIAIYGVRVFFMSRVCFWLSKDNVS